MARHAVERGSREDSGEIAQQLWLFLKKSGVPKISAPVIIFGPLLNRRFFFGTYNSKITFMIKLRLKVKLSLFMP